MGIVKEVKKLWGLEKWLINNAKYCGKLLYINRYGRCSLHRHPIKDETFYLFSGDVVLEINDLLYSLSPGQSVTIAPNTWHRFWGNTDSVIIEVSTHHDDEDVERDDRFPSVANSSVESYKKDRYYRAACEGVYDKVGSQSQ